MNHIIKTVLLINEEHKKFSEKNIDLGNAINLNKRKIKDFVEDESKIESSFLQQINNYCISLQDLYFEDSIKDLLSKGNTEMRIKDPVSRISKLLKYRYDKSEQGRVSVNKCLNDLLGFRIVVDNFNHYENECFNEVLAKIPIKVHNSCKGNYKATHLYFKNSNNKYFPWELQIWNEKDVASNFISHKEHKQGYKKWPELYKTIEDE